MCYDYLIIIFYFMQTFYNTMNHIRDLYFDYIESPFQVGHDIYEVGVPEWIHNGNGNWTFTGDKLDNIPDDIKGTIKFVSAPNATDVNLVCCDKLESFEAPKAIYILLIELDKLQVINAPKAIMIMVSMCNKVKELNIPLATNFEFWNSDESSLESIKAPNLQEVRTEKKHMDSIIGQFANNIENLRSFEVDFQDITQDIKNADREINNRHEKEVVQPYLDEMMVKVNQEPNRKKQIDTAFTDGDRGLVSALGSYEFADDQTQRKALVHALKSNNTTKNILQFNLQCNAIQKDFENYKKQHIVPKTHAHTAARETIKTALNGVVYR